MARLELLYSRNLWNINNNDMDKDTNLLKQQYSNNAIFFKDATECYKKCKKFLGISA